MYPQVAKVTHNMTMPIIYNGLENTEPTAALKCLPIHVM